jgi:hypothetical protein
VVRECLRAGRDRFGFRLIHYSVQVDHLPLLAEAESREALGRGVKGIAVRIARRLNRKLDRRGAVFAVRYHLHVLGTPTEVRNALVYVLGNGHRHVKPASRRWIDPLSSAPWFDGWRYPVCDPLLRADGPPPTVAPRSWLLREGWLLAGGPLEPGTVPRAG